MKCLRILALFFAWASILSSGMLAADDLIHVVGKGETVYSISRFYHVTPDELMKANGISDPSKLQTGKRLMIPSSAFSDITVTANPPAQTLTDYKVSKGDTLFSIAKKNDLSLQKLQEINNFSSNHVIKPGDIVKVPSRPAQNTAQIKPSVAGTAASIAKNGSSIPGILAMRWPVKAKEISYMTGQMGVIVEGEINEAVKSLTQGRVISAGPWRKFGKVAIVEVSGGYFYMYGGCNTLSVNVGDKIAPGTELGKLGVNAVSEKPQLFFMVFRSDTPIDPAKAPRAGGNAKT
ncbi:MAG: M23 family metallopeptidase [Treponema sp.]|jgi:LysM repeat protein|nr:M23 family metallopeptidase [Treponema sp.]